jgi:hypothetical protein
MGKKGAGSGTSPLLSRAVAASRPHVPRLLGEGGGGLDRAGLALLPPRCPAQAARRWAAGAAVARKGAQLGRDEIHMYGGGGRGEEWILQFTNSCKLCNLGEAAPQDSCMAPAPRKACMAPAPAGRLACKPLQVPLPRMQVAPSKGIPTRPNRSSSICRREGGLRGMGLLNEEVTGRYSDLGSAERLEGFLPCGDSRCSLWGWEEFGPDSHGRLRRPWEEGPRGRPHMPLCRK